MGSLSRHLSGSYPGQLSLVSAFRLVDRTSRLEGNCIIEHVYEPGRVEGSCFKEEEFFSGPYLLIRHLLAICQLPARTLGGAF